MIPNGHDCTDVAVTARTHDLRKGRGLQGNCHSEEHQRKQQGAATWKALFVGLGGFQFSSLKHRESRIVLPWSDNNHNSLTQELATGVYEDKTVTLLSLGFFILPLQSKTI